MRVSLAAKKNVKAARAAIELYLAGLALEERAKTIAQIEQATSFDRLAGVLLTMHKGGTLERIVNVRGVVSYALARKPAPSA